MPDEKLKSCPFCGSQPRIKNAMDNFRSVVVVCTHCGAHSVEVEYEKGLRPESVKLISEAWNRRSSPAADHGALHELVCDFIQAVEFALDESEETDAGNTLDPESVAKVCEKLDALNELPDKPGYTCSAAAKVSYALRSAPAAGWRPIDSAPKDGTAFLAYGRHAEDHVSHRDDAPKKGDHWWAIILWDVWREPRFVFSKDGAATWGEPTHWQPLPSPPK